MALVTGSLAIRLGGTATIVLAGFGADPWLHWDFATPVAGSMYISVMVAISSADEKGVITALPTLKKLVRAASSTVLFRETISASSSAAIETLRLIAKPVENSTIPKNTASISGTIIANSTAILPRLSRRSLAAANRSETGHLDNAGFMNSTIIAG